MQKTFHQHDRPVKVSRAVDLPTALANVVHVLDNDHRLFIDIKRVLIVAVVVDVVAVAILHDGSLISSTSQPTISPLYSCARMTTLRLWILAQRNRAQMVEPAWEW